MRNREVAVKAIEVPEGTINVSIIPTLYPNQINCVISVLQQLYNIVDIYCGMYIPLSDDEHRFVQKVHIARANSHWEHGRNSNPVAT